MGQPAFVTQIVNLLNAILTWILIIIPVSGGTMIGWHALQKQMADGDAGEIADREKKMKDILKTTVIAFIGAGVVKALAAFFG